MISRPAVFLDKDGTVIEDVPYNVDPSLMRFTSGAAEGLSVLHRSGYLLIVITNQSGVARGLFGEESLREVEQQLKDMLAEINVPLTGFYYCPHHPDGIVPAYAIQCACRKPAHELVMRAAHDHRVDLACSWFVGDNLNDVEAGRRAGCRTVLIKGGHEIKSVISHLRTPHYIASDLAEAARAITNTSPPVISLIT